MEMHLLQEGRRVLVFDQSRIRLTTKFFKPGIIRGHVLDTLWMLLGHEPVQAAAVLWVFAPFMDRLSSYACS